MLKRVTFPPGIIVCVCALLFASGCNRPSIPYVRLTGASQAASAAGQPAEHPLHLAVAAGISPKATLDAYGPLVDYLSNQLAHPVELVQRHTYAEINDLVSIGEVDVAFVDSGAFIAGERDFGLELLVAPQVHGQTVNYSYLIVPRDSTVQSLADLRNKSFAFTDPLSNSGHLVPLYLLYQMNERPKTFFSRTLFTFSHDNSINAVAHHLIDGAAVDSMVYDYVLAHNSTYGAYTRIIAKSLPYAAPPVVVHPNLNVEMKSQLRAAFLGMAESEQGLAALSHLMIDRFVGINPAAYDGVREMAAKLREW